MRRVFATAVVVVVLALAVFEARAVERFPQPEFESGHTLPSPTTPNPRGDAWEYIDVAVLLAALSLVTWLALKRRSRRGSSGRLRVPSRTRYLPR